MSVGLHKFESRSIEVLNNFLIMINNIVKITNIFNVEHYYLQNRYFIGYNLQRLVLPMHNMYIYLDGFVISLLRKIRKYLYITKTFARVLCKCREVKEQVKKFAAPAVPAAIPAGTRKSTISSQHHDYCIHIALYGYVSQAMIKNGPDMLTQTDKHAAPSLRDILVDWLHRTGSVTLYL
ncbi:hypothetical protein QTP88_022220 [Uroleucon formosanum]